MKFPLWILAVVIFVSLLFVVFAVYNLYKAEVLTPSNPQEAVSQIVESATQVEKREGQQLAVPSKSDARDESAAGNNPKTGVEVANRRFEKSSIPDEGVVTIPPQKERLLQKIGSIGVNAGEVLQVALTKS